jgi:hypothetical protein
MRYEIPWLFMAALPFGFHPLTNEKKRLQFVNIRLAHYSQFQEEIKWDQSGKPQTVAGTSSATFHPSRWAA